MSTTDRPSASHGAGWRWPVLLFAVTVAVHLALTRHMRTPVIHADEFGYLMGAHFMARGGPPTGTPYYPGYSAFLVPLWWLSDDTATVYRWSLDANAVLAGFTSVLVYVLGRRLAPALRPPALALAVTAVVAYPSLLLYSSLTESENVLVPAFLAVCLLALRAFEKPTPGRWAAVGGLTGLLYAVHGRSLAVVVGLALVGLWFLRPWKAHVAALLGGAAGMGLGLGVSALGIRWVTKVIPGRQIPSTASTPGHIASRVASGSGLAHIFVMLGGQGLYLLAGAGGLLVLGLVAAGRGARAARPDGARFSAPTALGIFLVTCVVLVAGLAAVFLDRGNRLDNVVYGRYVEVFAVPVFLVGLLAGAGRRLGLRVPVGWALVGVAVSAGVVIAYWGTTVYGIVVRTNSFAVADFFWGAVTNRLVVAALAGAALGSILLVIGALRVSLVVGALVVMGLSVAPTMKAYADLVDQSAARHRQLQVPTLLRSMQVRFGHLKCLSWNAAGTDADTSWQFYNDRLFVPEVPFLVFDSTHRQSLPCASGVVLAGNAFGSNPLYPGARLVLPAGYGPGVWVMPGPLQYTLGQYGWLLPSGFPGPLPASAATGSIRPAAGQPTTFRVAPGRSVGLSVVLSDQGTGSLWPPASLLQPVPRYAVRVAVDWYLAGQVLTTRSGKVAEGRPVADGRADLTAILRGGQSQTIPVRLDARGPAGPLAPGRYLVRLAIVQEGEPAWGAPIPPLWVAVTVG